MDANLIFDLLKNGPVGVVAILVAIVLYFHKRDQRNDRRMDERHKSCEDRNGQLDARIKVLEDRYADKLQVIANDALAGLGRNTIALKRFMRENGLTDDDSSTANPIHQPHRKEH